MRNVTISLPDDIYRQARIAAAELDSSLSAWVRALLIEKIEAKSNFNRLKALQDAVIESIESFKGGDRLSRDELYRR